MSAGGTEARIYATAARLRGQRLADESRSIGVADDAIWQQIDAIRDHAEASAVASTKLGAFAHADAAHAAADAAQAYVAYHRHGEPADHLAGRLVSLVEVAIRASDDARAIEAVTF